MKTKSQLPKQQLEKYSNSKAYMFGRDSCGYTVKMKDLLMKQGLFNKFIYIDVTKPENKSQYESLKVNGVPAFEHNGRIAVGYMEPSDLFKKLNM